jgi:hypothetical protein
MRPRRGSDRASNPGPQPRRNGLCDVVAGAGFQLSLSRRRPEQRDREQAESQYSSRSVTPGWCRKTDHHCSNGGAPERILAIRQTLLRAAIKWQPTILCVLRQTRKVPPKPGQRFLFPKRSWTADERTAPKIKSQQPVRIPRDSDPDALPDFAGFLITAAEP